MATLQKLDHFCEAQLSRKQSRTEVHAQSFVNRGFVFWQYFWILANQHTSLKTPVNKTLGMYLRSQIRYTGAAMFPTPPLSGCPRFLLKISLCRGFDSLITAFSRSREEIYFFVFLFPPNQNKKTKLTSANFNLLIYNKIRKMAFQACWHRIKLCTDQP
jgi:hypothetical protein